MALRRTFVTAQGFGNSGIVDTKCNSVPMAFASSTTASIARDACLEQFR
jgi:hypothetical protein